MTQEALKLALDALERLRPEGFFNEAITAIKEALREHAMREVQRLGQEIEQEPVVGITAIRTWFKDGRVVTQTLCNSWVDTTPPQRTWVGLTDAEAQLIYDMGRTPSGMMEMVEAKLKEKNT
jgi:hypothetical protein